ncbi:hypothetical protein [Stenotrophomonas sp. PD6]|uniref:hypothetical protein n=1 Tax=Stenotrophomonas sp. PD6 TaxID=3368612 RepID=UPI003B9E75C2
MERQKKQLSIADVAGWGSALATFGLVQGALYLQAYWREFGLDPFQFVAVGEIALAGLAGIGLALGLMLFAILLGDWLGGKLTSISPDRKVLVWLAPFFLVLGLGAIIWWANAWAILIGALLSVVCLVVVTLSPVVPEAARNSPWITYAVVMLVYFSVASNWLGTERAQKIVKGEGEYFASVTLKSKTLDGLNLIGRLGDTYALWNPEGKKTILLAASEFEKLEITRGRPATPPDVP